MFLLSSFSIFSNLFFHILSFMQKNFHFGEQDGGDDGAIDVIVFVVVSKGTWIINFSIPNGFIGDVSKVLLTTMPKCVFHDSIHEIIW